MAHASVGFASCLLHQSSHGVSCIGHHQRNVRYQWIGSPFLSLDRYSGILPVLCVSQLFHRSSTPFLFASSRKRRVNDHEQTSRHIHHSNSGTTERPWSVSVGGSLAAVKEIIHKTNVQVQMASNRLGRRRNCRLCFEPERTE
jgi:hypothetical protein